MSGEVQYGRKLACAEKQTLFCVKMAADFSHFCLLPNSFDFMGFNAPKQLWVGGTSSGGLQIILTTWGSLMCTHIAQ